MCSQRLLELCLVISHSTRDCCMLFSCSRVCRSTWDLCNGLQEVVCRHSRLCYGLWNVYKALPDCHMQNTLQLCRKTCSLPKLSRRLLVYSRAAAMQYNSAVLLAEQQHARVQTQVHQQSCLQLHGDIESAWLTFESIIALR